jgi:hypothetical protein
VCDKTAISLRSAGRGVRFPLPRATDPCFARPISRLPAMRQDERRVRTPAAHFGVCVVGDGFVVTVAGERICRSSCGRLDTSASFPFWLRIIGRSLESGRCDGWPWGLLWYPGGGATRVPTKREVGFASSIFRFWGPGNIRLQGGKIWLRAGAETRPTHHGLDLRGTRHHCFFRRPRSW